MNKYIKDDFYISTSVNDVDIIRVKALLSISYWAADRAIEDIKLSIKHSACFSIYKGDLQVGFARVVTDYSTFGYLADVIIDPKCRGLGLGKYLVEFIVNDIRWSKKLLMLATNDAHNLYEKYGFKQSTKLMSLG